MQLDIVNIVFFSLLLILLYFTVGFSRKKSLINYNAIQTIVICFIIYYVLIYVFGLFFGFLSSSYSLTFINILKNVLSATILMILKELYRYIVVQKTKNKNRIAIVIVTLFFTILNVIMEINIYDLSNAVGIFEFIEASLIPNLALNILLTYIAYKFNYSVSIVFLLLYEIPNYFLPIFPDMGNYFGSLMKIIFVFICYYRLSLLLEKYERRSSLASKKNKNFVVVMFLIPIFILIGLVSGIFKYHLFAIGSNSMIPVFARGDAVLIEKINLDDLDEIVENDIIAFYYNNQIIVHRVVSIEEKDGIYIFETKGDNNASIDAWTTVGKDVYGKVKYVVKYIGIPSIELNEFIRKER